MAGAHALHRDTPAFVVARKEPGANSRPLTAIASFRVLEARFCQSRRVHPTSRSGREHIRRRKSQTPL